MTTDEEKVEMAPVLGSKKGGEERSNQGSKSSSSSANIFQAEVFGLVGCLAIIGLLSGVLGVLVQIRNRQGNNKSTLAAVSSTTVSESGNVVNYEIGSSINSERAFIPSLEDAKRICGGLDNLSARYTMDANRNAYLWNVTVRESICCNDWTNSECHVLGLKCADCSDFDGQLAVTGKCDGIKLPFELPSMTSEQCAETKGRTLNDLLEKCDDAGGVVKAVVEEISHKTTDQTKATRQKGLVAKCLADEVELYRSSLVCGSCETPEWGGNPGYIQREDCRMLDPIYPACGNKYDDGPFKELSSPLISVNSANDLLSLCRADEIAFDARRVHPLKFGDGNEIELYAYCNNIVDYSMYPIFGASCGHCEQESFVPSGLCDGVDLEVLESEAKCSSNKIPTDFGKVCGPNDGWGSTLGFVGEFGGNLTRALIVCCGDYEACPDMDLSGIFCGECVGPNWDEYVAYRNCSGNDPSLISCN